jgi:hypothetical protein
MPEYLQKISKISNATSNTDIKIVNTILNYYYYFNELGDVVNKRMMMKREDKNLILLGNFKLRFNKENNILDTIFFTSPTMEIIINGSFRLTNGCIIFNSHREVKITVSKSN